MKHVALRSLQFLAFALVFLPLALFAYGLAVPPSMRVNLGHIPGAYGHLATRLDDLETRKDVDLLVLGSSHAYREFDPRVFAQHGVELFNLGSSSQTPLQTEILLKRYLDRLNPKAVVFEVFPGVFQSDGVEASLDLISNDRLDPEIVGLALSQRNVKVLVTLAYAAFYDLWHSGRPNETRDRAPDHYVTGGFVERDLSRFQAPPAAPPRAPVVFRAEQKAAFERILATLRERSIAVTLVQAPVTRGEFDSVGNSDAVNAYFSSRGVPYVDAATELPLDDGLFYDSHHLNQEGVVLFNQFLIDRHPGILPR